MAGLTALVGEKSALEARRDAALASLAERRGVETPTIRSGGLPKPLTNAEYLLGHMALFAFLLEQVQALATEVDELRGSVSKKGSK